MTPAPRPALPVPEPRPDEETGPFWQATRDGDFLLQRCASCERISWPPRSFCPHCGAAEPAALRAQGRGTVYSYTVVRKASGAWRDATPYVVAYVELAEGPRVLANIVDTDPETVHIGMPVLLSFAETANGFAVYRFVPAPGQA
ncbi:MAG TPA: Zn-ribbon domain-containing OB-fold protein [Mycobacteriales bacterium]|nr:Zn-ribbon domain-containing OB-fold protein [Mycobacteriales bacterium]